MHFYIQCIRMLYIILIQTYQTYVSSLFLGPSQYTPLHINAQSLKPELKRLLTVDVTPLNSTIATSVLRFFASLSFLEQLPHELVDESHSL